MPETRRTAGRLWQIGLGLLLAVGFGWLFARELDWEAVREAFRGVSPGAILLAVGFLACGWGLRITRWWWLLRASAPGLPISACAGPFLSGMAVNNLLPFRAGDALRVTGYRRQLRSPLMRVAGTLAIERMLDIAVLAGVFFFCLLDVPDDFFSGEVIAGVAVLAGASGAAVLAVALFPSRVEGWSRRLAARVGAGEEPASDSPVSGNDGRPRGTLSARLLAAISRHGAHFGESLRALRSRSQTLALFGLSGLAWFCEGSVFFVVAAAIDSGAAPSGPWLALAVGTLSTTLPSTPGYLGTFHYFAARGLAAFGAAPAEAAAFALTVHAVLWTTSTVTGLAFLLRAVGVGGLFRMARGGRDFSGSGPRVSRAEPDPVQDG